VALQIPSVQQFAAQKATNYLAGTLKTKVSIGSFTTDWRNSLVLKEIYLEDQKGDTLLYAGRLGVDLNIFGLLNSKLNISSAKLDNATVKINSTLPDSVYNFDFILKAFASDPTKPIDTTAAPFTYKIGEVELNNIRFKMDDAIGGNNILARIGHFTGDMDVFDPKNAIYRVGDIALENTAATFLQTSIPKTSSDSLNLDIGFGKIALKNVKFSYLNSPASQRIQLDIGRSELAADKIDLRNAKIDLSKFDLQNASVAYFQDLTVSKDSLAVNPVETAAKLDSAAEKQKGRPVNWIMTLDDVNLANVNFEFGNFNTPEIPKGMDFNHLKFTNVNADLADLYYSENKMSALIQQLQLQEKSGFKIANFQADINIQNTKASLRKFDLKTGYSHLRPTLTLGYPALRTIGKNVPNLTIDADLENSIIGAQDILYFAPFLANNPSFRKIAGRSLTIDGRLYGKINDLNAQNLKLKGLAGTSINLSGNLKNLTEIEKGNFNFKVNELTTTRTDLLALLPPNSIPKDITLPERFTISGGIRGNLKNLNLQNFKAAASGGTFLALNGTVQNLDNPKKIRLDLDVNNLTSTRSAVLALLPKGTIPPNIQLPEKFQVSGKFDGTPDNFTSNATIRSSFGNGVANVKMQPGERFSGTASLADFDLGKLLKQEQTLGKTTGKVSFQGLGLTPKTMQATFDADVQKIEYNNYAYQNITLKGTADHNVYNVTGSMKDANLAFTLNGDFNLNSANPSFKATLDLDGVNLKALNLYSEDLNIKGKLVADLTGGSIDEMKGTLLGSQLLLQKDQRNYHIDTLTVTLANSIGHTDIKIESDVVSGFFRGNNSVSDLAVALQKHFDSYFNIQDAPFPANVNLQDFEFDLNLKRPRIITAFVPGLTRIRPGTLKGNYAAANKNLNVDANLPRLIFQGYKIDSTKFQVRGDAEKIGYNLAFEELMDSTIQVRNLSVSGDVKNNTIGTKLNIAEDNGTSKFALAGVLNSIPNGFKFAFTPGEVIINKENWNVAPDNFLQYQNGNLFVNNVTLDKNGSILNLKSVGTSTVNAPLQMQFTNFELAGISNAIEKQDSLISGRLNGILTLRNLSKTMSFTSDLKVSNLAYLGNLIGDVALQASNVSANRYDILATLTGNGNNATVSGYYLAQNTRNALNLTADISTLNLKIIEGFGKGQLENLGGNVTGKLSITGSGEKPNIRGNATLTNAAFGLSMYNVTYKLQNETIVFDENGINFNNFTLLDSDNHKAVVTGIIRTQDYSRYRFDLNATTDNFLLINSTKDDYKLYYGKLLVDSKVRITGNQSLPVINADVKVRENSHLFIVIPTEAAAKVEQEGIVQFVNMHRRRRESLRTEEKQDSLAEAAFAGIDLSATVDIDEKSKISVIMDETSGDILEVAGNGTLNAGMDPAGNISLTGRYDVVEGFYKLHFYDIASRELRLEKGSAITWYGDPLTANIDIRAIYDVKAPVRELVSAQIAGESPVEQNKYRQQLPFLVYVNLNGDMLKPTITFNVQLPESERAAFGGQIDQRLAQLRQDPAEMNKQVFSLIVLNRFMAPDPLQSSGSGLQATARNSLSAVLGDQLNDITNKYAGGLGLELGLNSYEDYTTGEAQNRTDLNVAVRQELLNDRLIFRAGTDIGLEGKTPASQQSNKGFAGNFSVEYMLVPDGRLRVRGFLQDSYDMFTEAEVQETGAALVYQRDYNSFFELFKRVSKAQKNAK
jgi:translocation and assembly module TamB